MCPCCQSISLVTHDTVLKHWPPTQGLKTFHKPIYSRVFSSEPQIQRQDQFRPSLMASLCFMIVFSFSLNHGIMSNEKRDSVCTVTSVPVNSLCTGFGYMVRIMKCCKIRNAVSCTQMESCTEVTEPRDYSYWPKGSATIYSKNQMGWGLKNKRKQQILFKSGIYKKLWIHYLVPVWI